MTESNRPDAEDGATREAPDAGDATPPAVAPDDGGARRSGLGRARVPLAALVAGVLLAAAAGLGAGFLLKDQCSRRAWDGAQYRTGCYNDILALYGARGLDRQPMPYVDGNGRLDENEVGDLEYPVGTGYFVGAFASLVDDNVSFFRATALGLGIVGAVAIVVFALIADDRRRVLLMALSPSLVLYAFLNWDLLAVLFVALAFAAFVRARDGWAGAAIGAGAASKVFPGVFLPALALARAHRTRRFPWPMAGAAAAVFVALNLPVLALNARGWWFPWDFQSSRFPNFETSWYFLYRHTGGGPFSFDEYGAAISVISTGLFVVAAGVLLWREWRRVEFRPAVASLGLVLLFLLTTKVYSPQFALWVLPFFVLVRARAPDFIAFTLADAAVWVSISAFLLRMSHAGTAPGQEIVLEAAVWARYAVLAVLLWRSRTMDDNLRQKNQAPLV